MTKGTILQEIWNNLPEERKKRIKANANKKIEEYRSLQQFRKNIGLTQATLSKRLDIPQGNLSRLEQNSDMLLSTLRNYVEAAGGKLHLAVEMPDHEPIFLNGIGDLVEGSTSQTDENRPA